MAAPTRFNYMYGKGVERVGQDLSRELEDVFEEIPPYAVDVETGEFLNKTSQPVIKKTGQVNVKERIQSYADSVDIYKILEKFALSGDSSLINQRVGSFGDICDIPDNVNDFSKYVDGNIKELKKLDPSIASAIINDNISDSDLDKLVQEKVQAALIKAQAQKAETTTKESVE